MIHGGRSYHATQNMRTASWEISRTRHAALANKFPTSIPDTNTQINTPVICLSALYTLREFVNIQYPTLIKKCSRGEKVKLRVQALPSLIINHSCSERAWPHVPQMTRQSLLHSSPRCIPSVAPCSTLHVDYEYPTFGKKVFPYRKSHTWYEGTFEPHYQTFTVKKKKKKPHAPQMTKQPLLRSSPRRTPSVALRTRL